MSLTSVEKNLISGPCPVEGISPLGCQYLHSLVFSDGETVDNIPWVKNVYFENDTDIYSIRNFSKDKFQIVEGSSSACYPPKSHLPVIISGISGVLKQLEKGNKDYEITRKVPIKRIFPERYKFSHWNELYNTMREGWVSRGKVNIRDEYKHEGRWQKGDIFSMVHDFPEDAEFLERLKTALEKIDSYEDRNLFIAINQFLVMPITDIVVGREPEEIEKRGSAGCIFLGKHIVGEGEDAHLTNKILMDVSGPHVVLIVGKRGSGKSYSGAVIAEEIMKQPDDIRNSLSCIMLDTMGIFWSMKNPNEKDLPLLSEWNMKPSGFPIQNFVPVGLKNLYEKSGVGFDALFSIRPDELSGGDWIATFGISPDDPISTLLERIIKRLKKMGNYGMEEIIGEIERDGRAEEREKMKLQNKFLSAVEWGIFSVDATPIEDFLKPGIASVLDVSLQEWNVRNLMLSILARKIYEARLIARREEEIAQMSGESVKKIPMTWLIMDESHEFLPSDGKAAASDALLTLVRQGRQPGISCIFITQRPNKLHEDVIAQSDLVIAHRLTAKSDIDALSAIMQTYLLFDIKKFVSELPKSKGSALVLDDNSERLYNIQVRPRQSWHAGGSPSALKEET